MNSLRECTSSDDTVEIYCVLQQSDTVNGDPASSCTLVELPSPALMAQPGMFLFVLFFFHQEWELRTNVQRAIEDPAGNFLRQNRRFQSKGRSKKDSQANEMILLIKPDSLRLGFLNPNLMEGRKKKTNFHKSSFVLTGVLWHDPTPPQFKYNFKINKNDPWYQQV